MTISDRFWLICPNFKQTRIFDKNLTPNKSIVVVLYNHMQKPLENLAKKFWEKDFHNFHFDFLTSKKSWLK